MYMCNFRSHYQFIEDVTDAYIIGAFLDRFDMDNKTSRPSEIPVFSLVTDKEKVDWVQGSSRSFRSFTAFKV